MIDIILFEKMYLFQCKWNDKWKRTKLYILQKICHFGARMPQ